MSTVPNNATPPTWRAPSPEGVKMCLVEGIKPAKKELIGNLLEEFRKTICLVYGRSRCIPTDYGQYMEPEKAYTKQCVQIGIMLMYVILNIQITYGKKKYKQKMIC